MKRMFAAIAIAVCGSPSHAAPTESTVSAPVAAAASTAIPALGLRIGCKGKVQAMGDIAIVTCGSVTVSIAHFAPARTLDDAIAELRASAKNYLDSTTTREVRTAHTYRHEHHNRGASGENYWSDSALELGGRFYLCVAVPATTAEAATRAGDLCATLAGAP